MSDKCGVKGICIKNNVWQKEVALMGNQEEPLIKTSHLIL